MFSAANASASATEAIVGIRKMEWKHNYLVLFVVCEVPFSGKILLLEYQERQS